MRSRTDNMLTGILTGLIVPVVSFLIYVVSFREGEKVIDVLNGFVNRNVLTHVISLSVVPNLLVFFLFLWASKENSARGIIGATIIYALFVAGIILI